MRAKFCLPAFILALAFPLNDASSSEAASLPDAYWTGSETNGGSCDSSDQCSVTAGAGASQIGGAWYQTVNGAYVPGQPIILPPDLKIQTFNGGSNVAAVDFGIIPFPGIQVTAITSPDSLGYPNGGYTEADFQFTYFMEITGLAGNVPVFVQAHGAQTLSGGGGVGTELSISGPGGGSWGTNTSGTGSWDVKQGLDLTTNVLYTITLQASARAEGDTPSNAYGLVDPYFNFDPSFDSVGYSLVFSDGVGNSPSDATPIPATLPLFGAGLAGLGLLGCRRKQKAQGIAA